MKGTWRS